MNKSHRNLLFFLFIFLTLACALPGLSAPSEFPTPDPNSISTIVAGTANAAAMQTAQANPSTNTPLPTSTETPAPTSTATPTPRISAEGTSLVKQSDGSYIFTDLQGGYSVIVPSGWLVVRVNEQEYLNAWVLPEASDPKIQHFLTQFQNEDPKTYRLVGADIIPEHLQENFLTNFLISWNRNSTLTLQQEIDNAKTDLPRTVMQGAKISYADIGLTSTQIPMGIMELNWNTKDISGNTVKIYQKIVAFKVKSGTLAFTFSTTPDLKDAILNEFDLMTDQIKMLP